MAQAMNIAHCVESYAPSLGGMPEVVEQLSERMMRLGHNVTVFTSHHPQRDAHTINGVQVRAFHLNGNQVTGIVGDAATYRSALIAGNFDVVTFFAAQQWATDAMLPHLDGLKAKKVFVPTGFSLLNDAAYAEYYRGMPDRMRAMDLNVFLSQRYRDIDLARSNDLTNIVVIPNGAAEEEFEVIPSSDFRSSHGLAADERVILHVGSYTGIKGHKEAIRMFLKAKPEKATLVLVGNGVARLEHFFRRHWRFAGLRAKSALTGARILFLELDRPRTVEAMKQADLFLFPSRVECSPIVLFETLAAGVPFLSSRAGNAEEIVEWTQGGWTIPGMQDQRGWEEPDIAAGAALLRDLLARPADLRSAGQRGRAAWQQRFTWQLIAEEYVAQYQRLLNDHAR